MQLIYVHPPTGYTPPELQPSAEFPKFVHFSDGRKSVIAEDAEQEAAILAGNAVPELKPTGPLAPPAPIVTLVGENDELTMLRKIAADKGIHLDGRWKLNKIRAAVEAASPKAEKG